MKYLFCFYLILSVHLSFSQNKDEIVALKANLVVNKYFKNLSKEDYLLYNIDDFYLVIIKKGNTYKKYRINEYTKMIDSSFVSKRGKKLFRIIFNKPLSPFSFIYFEKDSLIKFGHYALLHYNPEQLNYFVLRKSGIKYIEYCIPPLFISNEPKVFLYPISKELCSFLFSEFGFWLRFKYSQNYDGSNIKR